MGAVLDKVKGFARGAVRTVKELTKPTAYKGVWLAIAALFLIVPFVPVLRERMIFFMFLLKWIALAAAFNLIAGYTGYVCFGFPVFYGMGAIMMAWAVGELGLHPVLGFLMAVGSSILMALVVGGPSLRLRGAYFAIASLAICLAMKVVVAWLRPYGIFIMPDPRTFLMVRNICYYIVALTALGTVLATYIISRSKLGLAMISIREDEDAAETRGVNTTFYKLVAAILCSIPPALVGASWAWYTTYSYEGDFEISPVVTTIAMTMLGGSGTVLGPVIGAAILYVVEYFLWASFPYTYLLIFGAIIVITVLFVPKGIVGLIREKVPKARKYLF